VTEPEALFALTEVGPIQSLDDVAPIVDWAEAARRVSDVDRQARAD